MTTPPQYDLKALLAGRLARYVSPAVRARIAQKMKAKRKRRVLNAIARESRKRNR
jgi:macrodomain Ter protein organizer (MatP/YcbG family)